MIKVILNDGREFVYDGNTLDFIMPTIGCKPVPKIYICNGSESINCFFVDEIEQILILEKKKKDKAHLKDDVKALKESVELQREAIHMLNERVKTLEKALIKRASPINKEHSQVKLHPPIVK